jgi:hypothetical protein
LPYFRHISINTRRSQSSRDDNDEEEDDHDSSDDEGDDEGDASAGLADEELDEEDEIGGFGEAIVGNRTTSHGRVWTVVPDIAVDLSAGSAGRGRVAARMNFGDGVPAHDERSLEAMFYRLFPMQVLDIMVNATNDEIIRRRLGARVTKGELLKAIGMRLAMTLEPRRGGLEAFFTNGAQEGTTFTNANYAERFKMSFVRFKNIWQAFRLTAPRDIALQPVRSFCYNFSFSLTN